MNTEEYFAPPTETKTLDLSRFSHLKFKQPTTLFNDVDYRLAVAFKICPMPDCGRKLYLIRNGKMYMCKSNRCKNYLQTKKRFLMTANKAIK